MPLTRSQVCGFTADRTHLAALKDASCKVVARLPDGSEMELPEGTSEHLAAAYEVADRAGAAVPVGGDGETVSAREAAQMLGVSRPTIYKWLDQGRLSEQRDTHDHRVYRESIDRMLAHRQARHELALADLRENPDSPFNKQLLEEARAMRASIEA